MNSLQTHDLGSQEFLSPFVIRVPGENRDGLGVEVILGESARLVSAKLFFQLYNLEVSLSQNLVLIVHLVLELNQVLVHVLKQSRVQLFVEFQVQFPPHSVLLEQDHFPEHFQFLHLRLGLSFFSLEQLLQSLHSRQ